MTAGRRYIESKEYLAARESGILRTASATSVLRDPIEVLDEAGLRSALHLRTFSHLGDFDIEGVPFPGWLPAAALLPSFVETIPVEKINVELATELLEIAYATAVDDGTPFSEAALNFGQTPTKQKVPRFGVAAPITLGVLDEPGQVSSEIDKRLELGVGLGLENDILNGNGLWTGALGQAGLTQIKGSGYRSSAIRNAVGQVQAQGWYTRPLQVVIHPTTMAAVYTEQDSGASRPIDVNAMMDGQVDRWIPSKFMPVGQALVGDFFGAIALFVKGGLTVAIAMEHLDFLVRSMVEMTVGFRCYAWVRQPNALCAVTGIT